MASMINKKQNGVSGDNTPAKTPKRKLPEALAVNVWKPGQPSSNPLGRPKGSRNKLSEAVIKDILADWEVAGPSAVQACRLEDPAAYLRIVTSLVPKEFNIKDSESVLASIIDQFDEEQLDQFIGLLDAIATGSLETGSKGPKTKTLIGVQPNSVY